MNQTHLEILNLVLSAPTAPFHEQAVAARISQWAKDRGLECSADKAGNLLVHYRGPRRGNRPEWVFAAHMDHPGFVVRKAIGRRVWADFVGGVAGEYFPGTAVRFFTPDGELRARVKTRRLRKGEDFPCITLELDAPAHLAPGTLGMWDLPAMRVSGRRLASRACDDVAGVAAVLCVLNDLAQQKAKVNVTGLLTRAEEAGFIGMLAACEANTLDKATPIVTIECSKAQPSARLGDGVVVRVGDKARTFDPSLTARLSAVAAGLAKEDKDFRFTRALMPGGTCESTPLAIWGYRTAAVCVPLGNYHNQGPGGRIRPERIDLGDFESLVKLLAALAVDESTADCDAQLQERLRGLLKSRRQYL